MVDQCNFVTHGCLFLTYTATIIFWGIWNGASNAALEQTVTFKFITHLKSEYDNWLKSYYQCLLLFSFANGAVQLFTIYIFYNLTRKTPERSTPHSLIKGETPNENEVERLSNLEVDHIQTVIDKSKAHNVTADLIEPLRDDVSSRSGISDNLSALSRNNSAEFVGTQNKLNQFNTRHRIFAQFIKNEEETVDQSVTNKTARTAATTNGRVSDVDPRSSRTGSVNDDNDDEDG